MYGTMRAGLKISPFDERYLPKLVEWVRPLWSMVDWEGQVSTVDWRDEFRDLDVEFILRHNIFRNEFALQLTAEREAGGEELLAVALAAGKHEENDAVEWLAPRLAGLGQQEQDSFQLVVDYLEDMDRRTCHHMGDGDIRLTLFASGSPGGGGLILAELEERLRRSGFTSLYLWTDSDCTHQWYPRHGFELVEMARNEAFSTPQRDFLTYIFRKELTP